MKKTILAATLISLFSGAALANTTYELSHDGDKETTAKFDSELIGGLHGGIELVAMDNLKYHKETTFSLAYNFDITDAWYIEPQFDLTIPSHHAGRASYYGNINGSAMMPGGDEVDANYKSSNTAKLGIETGYSFDNGFYTSARYRYEVRDGKLKAKFLSVKEGIDATLSSKEKEKLHRFDLTAGYVVSDMVDLSANYIIKMGKLDIDNKVSEYKLKKSLDTDYSQAELELKAQYTGFDNFKPYFQYTIKGDTDFDGSLDGLKLKNDNVWKVGAQFSF
ncbi:autotransporter outer membrane beta-barrel domain-containing protein [Photobacterium sp. SDRW27]|uniref:hypothetical protein n=1 Tax=Photobacterium obscurum TaxID=2829490 RepID=UPI0022440A37|nr:hypothetical protein [Photobacterium obscurum]MCW8330846.1 autotransporter outer membrane beta-barrel domain-containing protein [Photobacterium obscurum]